MQILNLLKTPEKIPRTRPQQFRMNCDRSSWLTMKPPLWFELLSESREVVISQHSSIQRIHSLPRVCRSMRGLPMVLHTHPTKHQHSRLRDKCNKWSLKLWIHIWKLQKLTQWARHRAGRTRPAEPDEPWRRGRRLRRLRHWSGRSFLRCPPLQEFPERLSV